jgi:tetratricopeptide (TPR) repeat protein
VNHARLTTLAGDTVAGDLYIREATAFADVSMLPWEQSSIYAMAAEAALDAKRPRLGLALAKKARMLAPAQSYPSLLAVAREAEALRLEGRVEESLRASTAAQRTLRPQEYPQILGQLLRTDAQNLQLLGHTERARTALSASIDVLRDTQYGDALARSLELAGNVLLDAKLAAEAKELRTSI